MGNGFTVSFLGDHVRIDSDAKRSLEYAIALWTELVRVCEAHDCYNVLAVSNAPGPMPITDGYDHADLFVRLGVDQKYKIAWAELSDDARSATSFVETVLLNRGLPGTVFTNEDDARQWLFSKNEGNGS